MYATIRTIISTIIIITITIMPSISPHNQPYSTVASTGLDHRAQAVILLEPGEMTNPHFATNGVSTKARINGGHVQGGTLQGANLQDPYMGTETLAKNSTTNTSMQLSGTSNATIAQHESVSFRSSSTASAINGSAQREQGSQISPADHIQTSRIQLESGKFDGTTDPLHTSLQVQKSVNPFLH